MSTSWLAQFEAQLQSQLAAYRALSASGQSLFMWNVAVQAGKFVTVSSNGGYVDPSTGSIDGNGIVHSNGQTWGFAVAVIDAPKHGVAAVIQDVSNVASDIGSVINSVGSFLASLPGDLVGAFTKFISLLSAIINEFGQDLDGLLELGEFVVSIAGHLLALVDPTGTSQSRQNALNSLSPLYRNGPVYNFLTSDQYAKSRHLLILTIIAGPALFAFAILEILLGHVSPQLAEVLSPANMVDGLLAVLAQLIKSIASGQNIFVTVQNVLKTVLHTELGIECSPACLVKLTYQVIEGLPIPPIPMMITTLLADPVAQASMAQLVGVPALAKVLPVAITCFDAADSGSWLDCFEVIIESIFPQVISGLKKYAIDLNDLRVIIDGVWSTGGDFSLMLSSPAINRASSMSFRGVSSSRQSFAVMPSAELSPMQMAMISVGFFGVEFIASKVGIQNAAGLFESSIIPLLPAEVADSVRNSLDVFHFFEQLLISGGKLNAPIKHTSVPSGFALYLLESFHENKWDVESTVSQIIADELDPVGSSPRLFSACLKKTNGVMVSTPATKNLFGKVLTDFPRLTFMLDAVAVKNGLKSARDLIGVEVTKSGSGGGSGSGLPSTNTTNTTASSGQSVTPGFVKLVSGGSSSGSSSSQSVASTPNKKATNAPIYAGAALLAAGILLKGK